MVWKIHVPRAGKDPDKAGGNEAAAGYNGKEQEIFMIARREKLQYGCLFMTDLVSLVASVAVAWLIMDGLFGKMTDFREPRLVLEACVMLFIAYVLTIFRFRPERRYRYPEQHAGSGDRGRLQYAAGSVGCGVLGADQGHHAGFALIS